MIYLTGVSYGQICSQKRNNVWDVENMQTKKRESMHLYERREKKSDFNI